MGGAKGGSDFEALHGSGDDVVDHGEGMGADTCGVGLAIGALHGCAGGRFVDIGFAPALNGGLPLEGGEGYFFAIAVGKDGIEPAAVVATVAISALFDDEVEVVDPDEANVDINALFFGEFCAFKERGFGGRSGGLGGCWWYGDGKQCFSGFFFTDPAEGHGGGGGGARIGVSECFLEGFEGELAVLLEAISGGAEGELGEG